MIAGIIFHEPHPFVDGAFFCLRSDQASLDEPCDCSFVRMAFSLGTKSQGIRLNHHLGVEEGGLSGFMVSCAGKSTVKCMVAS